MADDVSEIEGIEGQHGRIVGLVFARGGVVKKLGRKE
jgi:hypothetical protein